MPFKKCTRDDGSDGWTFGDSTWCSPTLEDAIKRAYSFAPEEVKKELEKMEDSNIDTKIAYAEVCDIDELEGMIYDVDDFRDGVNLYSIYQRRVSEVEDNTT